MTRSAPFIPDRDALLRDGIPPEVTEHFRRQAVLLRAQVLAALFARLRAAMTRRPASARPAHAVGR